MENTLLEIDETIDDLAEWRHEYYRKNSIYENYKAFRDIQQAAHLKVLVADLIGK